MLPETKEAAHVQRLALEVEDLIAQIRWQVGHALLLVPYLPQKKVAANDAERLVLETGLLGSTLLIFRNYTREPNRVMFADLETSRRGTTAGGWVFQMLIDNAVFRSVAALDRLARVVWTAAKLQDDRVYFSEKKLARVHRELACSHSLALKDLASSDAVQAIVEYRNGYAHTRKASSDVAGVNPAATWKNDAGGFVVENRDAWDAPHLLNFAVVAYRQVATALSPATRIVHNAWPLDPEYETDEPTE
jgi:hypothetical protein